MKESNNYFGIIGFAVLYAVTVFLSAFLGFLHPLLWVGFPVIAAFVGAFSYYKVASKLRSFGAGVLCAVIFAGCLLLVGEINIKTAGIMLVAGIVSDFIRQLIGNATFKGISLAYPILAIGVISWILPLWTRTEWYHDGAVKEMGKEYAEGLMTFSSPFGLCMVIVLTLVLGYLGIYLASKWMKSSFQ